MVYFQFTTENNGNISLTQFELSNPNRAIVNKGTYNVTKDNTNELVLYFDVTDDSGYNNVKGNILLDRSNRSIVCEPEGNQGPPLILSKIK